jgi:hypothetical protein
VSTILKTRDKTKLFLTSKNKDSLRSTVPMSIVRQLNLTENDYLGWQLEFDKDRNRLIVVVTKE